MADDDQIVPRKPVRRDAKAVALGYDGKDDPAPRVVAKGEGFVAERMIEIAEQHGVHIKKDAPLVEILSALELNDFIPFEAYSAVAEILSYLYRTNAAMKDKKPI